MVDVGSNSVLLTVAEREKGGWREVFGSSQVTGLGTDTKATGLLQKEAREKTLAAIKRAFEEARVHGAPCAAAATMAVRIATNADEFLAQARKQGTPVSVLSGDDEARLGLAAVMRDPEFAGHPLISVIDPGGHSTELTTAVRHGEGYAVEFERSFPVGALGLRDGPMGAESPDRAARLKAVREIDDMLGLQYQSGQAGTAVALGATPTNLVAIRDGIAEFDAGRIHGQYLSYEEVSRSVGWMCEMSEAERADLAGMEKGREKTLHIGALILERFLSALHVDGCFVSTRGWRFALLDEDVYFR